MVEEEKRIRKMGCEVREKERNCKRMRAGQEKRQRVKHFL